MLPIAYSCVDLAHSDAVPKTAGHAAPAAPISLANTGRFYTNRGIWLRGLDSNQDNQIQSLVCYRLHYPGSRESLAEAMLATQSFVDSAGHSDSRQTQQVVFGNLIFQAEVVEQPLGLWFLTHHF